MVGKEKARHGALARESIDARGSREQNMHSCGESTLVNVDPADAIVVDKIRGAGSERKQGLPPPAEGSRIKLIGVQARGGVRVVLVCSVEFLGRSVEAGTRTHRRTDMSQGTIWTGRGIGTDLSKS